MPRPQVLKPPAEMLQVDPQAVIRFSRFVEIDRQTGCWLWKGHCDRKGYGQFRLKDRAHWAHRISYVIFCGPIPEGFQIDHTCNCSSCVNPEHLEAVPAQVNRERQTQRHASNTEVPF